MDSASINRIHVNNSTGLSLNERFTAIQTQYKTSKQSQSQPASMKYTLNGSGSVANRKFLQELEKKHKMETALKLKRRSLKGGLRARGGRNRNANALALRLAPNGKVIKARSLTNIATMKADLLEPVAQLQRSNSNLNLAGRIGPARRINRRRPSQISGSPGRRMRIRRNNTAPLNSFGVNTQNQMRGRSRSRSRTRQRSNSLSNLARRNSTPNAVRQQQRSRSRARSRSRSRTGIMNAQQTRPVHSRLGIKRVPTGNKRGMNRQRGGSRVARGRILKRRNSNVGTSTLNQNAIRRQGRSRSRSRVRNGTTVQGQRGIGGRSRSRGRNSNLMNRGRRNPTRGGGAIRRGRSRSRARGGRGGSSRGGGNNSNKKEDIKKEDLDNELDQYMASSNNDDI